MDIHAVEGWVEISQDARFFTASVTKRRGQLLIKRGVEAAQIKITLSEQETQKVWIRASRLPNGEYWALEIASTADEDGMRQIHAIAFPGQAFIPCYPTEAEVLTYAR